MKYTVSLFILAVLCSLVLTQTDTTNTTTTTNTTDTTNTTTTNTTDTSNTTTTNTTTNTTDTSNTTNTTNTTNSTNSTTDDNRGNYPSEQDFVNLNQTTNFFDKGTPFNNKCVTCVLQPQQLYYCTRNNECHEQPIQYYSCEKGIQTCIAYKTVDLGVLEIAPYNTTLAEFNYTVKDGQSIKFALSNEDPTDKAWYQIKIYETVNQTYLETPPKQFIMNIYDPNNYTSNFSLPYIYSKTGRSRITPLTTREYFIGANGGEFIFNILYGNTKYVDSNAIFNIQNWTIFLTFIMFMSYAL